MKADTIKYIFQIVTVCQAFWVLGIMIFLMWHYVARSLKNRFLEKNAIALGVSYSLMTICTMISSYRGLYEWHSTWYYILFIGYAFGDYAIVKMLFHVTRNERTKRIMKEYIKNNKN